MCFLYGFKKYKADFVFTACIRYGFKLINYDLFLQQAVRNNKSHVDALQAQIDHFYDLVEASETLKIIGNDLIKMSDQLALKDIVLKYGDKKTA